ncbi:acyl-CoA desaturase [Micromonospora rifamycinica]|uniref:fatty acid desaturase family protein n=1 Tax=Micromonospora rifamycinica TaxID=291594 RepID=UPI0033C4F622
MRQAGLLERRPTYYLVRIAVNAALVTAGWTIFVLVGDSWWQLVTAAYLAAVFTQSGFLGHDAGHRQIFRSRRANHLVGLVYGNLAIGLAFGWWVDKHHRHHAHPNTEGRDPDIAGEALAFTGAQARRRRGAGRLPARHQRLLFCPMLLLEGVALHVASVRALSRSTYRERGREALLLGSHAAAYLTVVFVVLSPLRALAFVVVQQGLFGLYLGCAFAPNHKGMPILGADEEVDFLRRQILTSPRGVQILADAGYQGLGTDTGGAVITPRPKPRKRQTSPPPSVIAAHEASRKRHSPSASGSSTPSDTSRTDESPAATTAAASPSTCRPPSPSRSALRFSANNSRSLRPSA